MIITRTPLVLTPMGGGLDLPEVTKYIGGGSVVTVAISKYYYVTVNKRVEREVRVSYRTTEYVSYAGELQHPVIRECLKDAGIKTQIEITTIAEVTSRGTALGSNSAMTVGLLQALYQYNKKFCDPKVLYEQSLKVAKKSSKGTTSPAEILAAIHGGINYHEFNNRGGFRSQVVLRREISGKFQEHLLLLATGNTDSGDKGRKAFINAAKSARKRKLIERINNLTVQFRENLAMGKVEPLGVIMDECWFLKKQLVPGMAGREIEALYSVAKKHGAVGGILTGVGTRGCLLLFANPDDHEEIVRALPGLKKIEFYFDSEGVKTVYNSFEG